MLIFEKHNVKVIVVGRREEDQRGRFLYTSYPSSTSAYLTGSQNRERRQEGTTSRGLLFDIRGNRKARVAHTRLVVGFPDTSPTFAVRILIFDFRFREEMQEEVTFCCRHVDSEASEEAEDYHV
jgi:hypothetical protein